jgi:hypothetical protein
VLETLLECLATGLCLSECLRFEFPLLLLLGMVIAIGDLHFPDDYKAIILCRKWTVNSQSYKKIHSFSQIESHYQTYRVSRTYERLQKY